GDEHVIAGTDPSLLAGPDADRQRLHQRARLVGDVVGQREREVLVDRDVVGERAVDRRRREEADVPAEVVPAGAALAAPTARHARLERHAIADAVLGDTGADRRDASRRLVPEHLRLAHHVRAYPAMLVVVDVRAALAYGGDHIVYTLRA